MHAELLFPRFMAANRDDAIGLRSKCKHFRVLVMGRANAGKTTLLKKVCNSVKDPEIFSPTGTEIHVSTVEGSDERGLHDIENQLIFKSNRQFIFHDSCGFESGSVVETEKVEAFIAQRAKSETLSEQLHAIWYCLPTDTNRPLLAADEKFFNTHDTRKVPVIAIFTKFDGLIIKAFTKLLGDELSPKDAKEGSTKKAQMMLATNFKGPLKKVQFPPSAYVRLDDMRQETSNCIELIGKTASTLTDDTLRLLLVSVQQNNINLCCESAVKDGLGSRDLEDIYRCKDIEGFHTFAPGVMRHTLAYFPHVWIDENYDKPSQHELSQDQTSQVFDNNIRDCFETFIAVYPHVSNTLETKSGCAEVLAAICICAEQTFTQASAKKQAFSAAFATALNAYHGSDLESNVNNSIARFSSQDYEEVDGPRWDLVKKVVPKLLEIIKAHRLRI